MAKQLYRCEFDGVRFVLAEDVGEARRIAVELLGEGITDGQVRANRVRSVGALPDNEQEADYFDPDTEEYHSVEFYVPELGF